MVLLHDLAGLVLSKKLVLPSSSWAFWAGFLSNATEVHVNAPPIHHLLPNSNYIYHHEKGRLFYGRYNVTTGDIDYAIDLNRKEALEKEEALRRMNTSSSGAEGRVRRLSGWTSAMKKMMDPLRGLGGAAEEDFAEYLRSLQRSYLSKQLVREQR